MKHIEQIQPEYAADDMTALLLSDATASAALSRLLHDWTGCDIPPLATTPQSDVDELVPLAVSILRRHWTTPLTALGDGTTPMSLADLLRQTIGDRVQGNEAWCIPPVHDNIPAAVSALRERKIGGVPEAPDGISIVQLLLTANTYGELKDNTVWGEYQEGRDITNPNTLSKMLSQFPSVTKLSVGWSKVTAVTIPGSANIVISNSTLTSLDCYALKEVVQNGQGAAFSFPNAVVDFSKLEKFSGYSSCHANGNAGLISRCANETLDFANLQSVTSTGSGSGSTGIVPIASSCTNLKRVLMPKMPAFASDNRIGSQYPIYYFWKCPNIEEIEVGTLTSFNSGNMFYSENNSPLLKLKKVVIGEGTAINLNFAYWEPSAETIADADFLPNFKNYIALRLTDNGSGKTLTLSQEVRDAIQQDPEIVSIITSKGWTISPAPSV